MTKKQQRAAEAQARRIAKLDAECAELWAETFSVYRSRASWMKGWAVNRRPRDPLITFRRFGYCTDAEEAAWRVVLKKWDAKGCKGKRPELADFSPATKRAKEKHLADARLRLDRMAATCPRGIRKMIAEGTL
jgi:hypothetical protein